MTIERMAYFARKYLMIKIANMKSAVERDPDNTMTAAALADYKQELQDLQDTCPVGNLTEEGHW